MDAASENAPPTCFSDADLVKFLQLACDASPDHPVVISKFVEGAREVELDVTACEDFVEEKGRWVKMMPKDTLLKAGFDPDFGARPLKRLIQREIGDRLALAVLEGRYLEGDKVTVDIEPDLSLPPVGETDGDKTVDNLEGSGETAEQVPEAATRTFVLR